MTEGARRGTASRNGGALDVIRTPIWSAVFALALGGALAAAPRACADSVPWGSASDVRCVPGSRFIVDHAGPCETDACDEENPCPAGRRCARRRLCTATLQRGGGWGRNARYATFVYGRCGPGGSCDGGDCTVERVCVPERPPRRARRPEAPAPAPVEESTAPERPAEDATPEEALAPPTSPTPPKPSPRVEAQPRASRTSAGLGGCTMSARDAWPGAPILLAGLLLLLTGRRTR